MEQIINYFKLMFTNPVSWVMCLAFILVYIFFEKKEVNKDEILQYIQNSDTIILDNFKFIDHKLHKKYNYSFFKRKNSNGFRNKEYILLEDLERKKYFELDYYDGARLFPFKSEEKMPKEFYAVINSEDLKNSKLGSQKKPIHVLFFYTNKDSKNYYITEKQYLINVKEYLSYDR